MRENLVANDEQKQSDDTAVKRVSGSGARKCPICKTEYNDGGERWKKVCYDCYKNYRFLFSAYEKATPIKTLAYKSDIYLSHPSVTKEQMDAWIKEKGLEHGWGCEEWLPENWKKFKVWINSTNYD